MLTPNPKFKIEKENRNEKEKENKIESIVFNSDNILFSSRLIMSDNKIKTIQDWP